MKDEGGGGGRLRLIQRFRFRFRPFDLLLLPPGTNREF